MTQLPPTPFRGKIIPIMGMGRRWREAHTDTHEREWEQFSRPPPKRWESIHSDMFAKVTAAGDRKLLEANDDKEVDIFDIIYYLEYLSKAG